jgi:PITH domain
MLQHCKIYALSISCTSPTHRPKTLRIFINRPNAIGFDEAETVQPTQVIELTEQNYSKEGTAIINLRYVKFQRVNTLSVLPYQDPLTTDLHSR